MTYGNCCDAEAAACGCGCSGQGCGCGCGNSGARKFFTKEEKIAMLEEYKKQLEKETAGVGEKIKHLKKAE